MKPLPKIQFIDDVGINVILSGKYPHFYRKAEQPGWNINDMEVS